MKKKHIYKFIALRIENYVRKKWNSNVYIGRISGNVLTRFTITNLVLTDIKGCPEGLQFKADSVDFSYLPLGILWQKFNADFREAQMSYKNIVLDLDIRHRRGLTTAAFKKAVFNLEDLKDFLPKDISLTGSADISGGVILRNFKPHILHLSLGGEDCQVRYDSSLQVEGSVNLEMNGSVNNPSISGMVKVSKLSLPYESAGLSLFRVLRLNLDSGFLKRAALNINIQGRGVIVKNSYINAPVNIFLKLKKERDDEPYLLGKIEVIKGIYEAYGNQFKINKGEMVFNGKTKSPLIDVEAEAKIRRYKIFAKVKGDLENSRLTLTSKPELRYPEIVSLIAFGKNIDELTGTQKELLTASDFNSVFINCLFMGKAETKIAKVMGLDEINVGFNTSSNDLKELKSPSVEIGKTIVDEKVYGTYSVKPSVATGESPEQAVGSELEITEHMKIKGQRIWQESWNSPKEDKVGVEFRWKF